MVLMHTSRLTLRELTFEDFVGVHAFASDPEVCQFTVWGPNTSYDTRNFLKIALNEQTENPRLSYNLAVVHPSDGVIGGCGINVNTSEYRSTSIGYFLNKCYWGLGYGSEIARRLISYGFEDLKMYRMTAECDS